MLMRNYSGSGYVNFRVALRLLVTCLGREPFQLLFAFAFAHESRGGIAFEEVEEVGTACLYSSCIPIIKEGLFLGVNGPFFI